MPFERVSTNPSDYVVLDVETNGLSAVEDDLLSISLYKPDDGKTWERFLPLELNHTVATTSINGITDKRLSGLSPLTQNEWDAKAQEFELHNRTILHYGDIDRKFIQKYMKRHCLSGYTDLKFLDIKKRVCSPIRYPHSIYIPVTKDNLCRAFLIDGVSETHSGLNDCRLEWELFKAMDGKYILWENASCLSLHQVSAKIFLLDEGYLVPVTKLANNRNLNNAIKRPTIDVRANIAGTYRLDFPLPFKGKPTLSFRYALEYYISQELRAKTHLHGQALANNKGKLRYISTLIRKENDCLSVDNSPQRESVIIDTDLLDSTLNELRSLDYEWLDLDFSGIGEWLRKLVFGSSDVIYHELVMDDEKGILAICDFSSSDAVLEIKTIQPDESRFAEQIHYQAAGRDAFLLGMRWTTEGTEQATTTTGVHLILKKLYTREIPYINPTQARIERMSRRIGSQLSSKHIKLLFYRSQSEPIKVRCEYCGAEWETTYRKIEGGTIKCPNCFPSTKKEKTTRDQQLSPEELLLKKGIKLKNEVIRRSAGCVIIAPETYEGSRQKVVASCAKCNHQWSQRADHLLERHWCPKCKSGKSQH